jgi:hypothetical protein
VEKPISTVPDAIFALVERFDRQQQAYRSGQYNETQLRREFLDPFWEALGWDVNNHQGYAEAYKDVIHEDAIKAEIRICLTASFLARKARSAPAIYYSTFYLTSLK